MSIWNELLDIVMPWRCPLCRAAGRAPTGLCAACETALEANGRWRCTACGHPLPAVGGPCCRNASPLDGLLAATDYQAGARKAVHLLKFGRSAPAGRAMGEILARAARERCDLPCDALVPVPLARRRQRKRGFNQAALLAKRVARELRLPVEYHLLERRRETSGQAELPAAERRRNLAGAFNLARGRSAVGQSLVLVDDVYTTGATLGECAAQLKAHGASLVIGLVFACSSQRRP